MVLACTTGRQQDTLEEAEAAVEQTTLTFTETESLIVRRATRRYDPTQLNSARLGLAWLKQEWIAT